MVNRKKTRNYVRFPAKKDKDGNNLCRVCGEKVKPPKRTFCDQRCLRDYYMQTDWQRVRRVIYERDGGICMKCGNRVSRDNFHVDHINPISNGGAEWDLENLELSCPACNLTKGIRL